jgi:hypothetical protein
MGVIMAHDTIIDSSAEMDPNSEQFAKMLAGSPPQADTGGKPNGSSPEPQSTEKAAEPDAKEGPSIEELQAKIKGLEAELGRRKGNADKIAQLESELEKVKAQREQTESGDDASRLASAIERLSTDALLEKKTEFMDEMADARADLKAAEREGDLKVQQEAAMRILRARKIIVQLDKALIGRNKAELDKATTEAATLKKLKEQSDSLITDAYEMLPDLMKDGKPNEQSEVWKAGDAEFRKRPELMASLGPFGELVSLAYALLKNPSLIPGGKADTRKELLTELENKTSKAFIKGSAAPTKKEAVPDYETMVGTPEGRAAFEKAVEAAKSGA